MLHVLTVEPIPREDLLGGLRETRLFGFGRARPYARATLELTPAVDTSSLAPAQRYVLRSSVAKILELRAALLAHGIDVFALDGGVRVRTSEAPGRLVPVIPPIVEESVEPDGRTVLIINDGIHRVFAARSLGLAVTTVIAREVPPEYPYYALPLARGWGDVAELDELPADFEKKAYRIPGDDTVLYRDFNERFPGVQRFTRAAEQRPVRSAR